MEVFLKCYPLSLKGKDEFVFGNKIILPSKILEEISTQEIEWPAIFNLRNLENEINTNCGVSEFTAEDGCFYAPFWIIKRLEVKPGSKVGIKLVQLEKGKFARLQPQSSDFLAVSNPKAILESRLRNFVCLTKSDVFGVEYNKKIFWFNVLEVKPGRSVCIIETDLDVDFAPPAQFENDVKPPVDNGPKELPNSEESTDSEKFTGGRRLNE
eukprot:CAMPEP_0184292416 /NCGR_PEP_ID=MMETSP1049-20130417/4205_1 /TAXON_ID=77928 /ORGANISM="Proteomonas sulcata, Strain CCMP704" /LENGTH=210 /DNA_ID=CAMNT_0026600195 /DNA_START=946 /DNA_END=1578 /DNA_ORIENTATION=+